MPSDVLEVLKQWSFLSSVLAGFGIAAAIELVSLGQKRRLVTAAIAVFLISAAMLTAYTFVSVFVISALIGSPGFPPLSELWLLHFVGGIAILPLATLLLFLVGIALVGWVHSKLLGIIATGAAFAASALVLGILISMGTPP